MTITDLVIVVGFSLLFICVIIGYTSGGGLLSHESKPYAESQTRSETNVQEAS